MHRQGRERDEVPSMHRRRASGETTSASGSAMRMSHPAAATATATMTVGRASRSGNPHQSPRQSAQQLQQQPHHHASQGAAFQRPIPVSTASYGRQPGFENLSRPSNGRRQTMIT